MSDTYKEINDTYSNCIEIENKSRTILFENENNRSERKAELLNSIIIVTIKIQNYPCLYPIIYHAE